MSAREGAGAIASTATKLMTLSVAMRQRVRPHRAPGAKRHHLHFRCARVLRLRSQAHREPPSRRQIPQARARSLPCRAVPGDGAIPFEWLLPAILAAGFNGMFDLEIVGPRLQTEGFEIGLKRAAKKIGAILESAGLT